LDDSVVLAWRDRDTFRKRFVARSAYHRQASTNNGGAHSKPHAEAVLSLKRPHGLR
jgi:hypothetical protein